MKYFDPKTFLLGGLALSAWMFSASVSAECVTAAGVPSAVVTEYGGSALSCPTGHPSGCLIGGLKNNSQGSCVLDNGDGTEAIVMATGNKEIEWTAYKSIGGVPIYDEGELIEDTEHGIDVVITDTATGANGCFQAFGEDQSSGIAGFQRDNGSYLATSTIAFCTDQKVEVTAVATPIAEVKECVIDGGTGESQEIWGVEFACANVPAGETRTIIITNDDVDDFGFSAAGNTTGILDFNNVCQCKGPTVTAEFEVTEEECDPNPDATVNRCLYQTPVNNTPIVITIQQPKCFTVGGFQRCF